MTTKPPAYKGHLDRDPATGIMTMEVRDLTGWPIRFTFERDPAGGYFALGWLGEPPASERIAELDDGGADND